MLLKASELYNFTKTLFVAYDTRIFQYSLHKNKSLVAMLSQKNAVQNINTKKRGAEMHLGIWETGNNREFLCSYSAYKVGASAILNVIKVCNHFRSSIRPSKVYKKWIYFRWKPNDK